MEKQEKELPEPYQFASPIYEPIGDWWLCAGECGQWHKGMAAAHNGSGYVCYECEHRPQPATAQSGEVGQ